MDVFEQQWKFSSGNEAIDECHIPIMKPLQCSNQKDYYSILVQSLVDSHGLFMDVNVGWPGKLHDARVFANSILFP